MTEDRKIIKPFILCFLLTFIVYLTMTGQVTQNKMRPRIIGIVNKLKKETTLHLGAPVGYAGKRETNNKYYKLFKRLGRLATDYDLVALTNDSLNTIVGYSFLLLHSRNYAQLKDVFLTHLNDATDIWIAGGCTGVIDQVNSFMLQRLNPASNKATTVYLTTEEFDKYSELIASKRP